MVYSLMTKGVEMVLDQCDGCGDDLEDGVVHDCPVLGTTVVASTLKSSTPSTCPHATAVTGG